MNDPEMNTEDVVEEVRLLKDRIRGYELEQAMALQAIEQSQAELVILNTISQATAIETNLEILFQIIHDQIRQVVGDVTFIIALYHPGTNQIEIPYAYDGTAIVPIAPFPLGEGLTSILIQTRQPLLLIENAEEKARTLGAKFVGKAAKSWLGVPLVVAGEVIGAIILQDIEVEHRFDEGDQRLLSILAPQLAVAIRNAGLLANARRQVEQQQILAKITNLVSTSLDMETILRTTLLELGQSLNATEGLIQLELPVN